MKRFILALTAFIASFSISAQTQDADYQFLEVVFGTEEFAQISVNTAKLDWYVFLDSQGYFIQDVAPKDISEMPDALLVPPVKQDIPALTEEIIQSESFHSMYYHFSRLNDENLYYRIGDSSKMMIIYSSNSLKKKYSESH
ncbi:MAG: hypothetical protein GC193_13590 [Cryomorphaceae bacterium]|nr:hypothetical protein [Cryomorphaceae bacterium]